MLGLEEQVDRLRPFLLRGHGRPRLNDQRVLIGIVFINRNGLRWRDAPGPYGSQKTL